MHCVGLLGFLIQRQCLSREMILKTPRVPFLSLLDLFLIAPIFVLGCDFLDIARAFAKFLDVVLIAPIFVLGCDFLGPLLVFLIFFLQR